MRKTQIIHFLHGFFGGLTFKPLPLLSLFLYLQFLLYEYFEETKIKDELYHELKEWSAGFFTGLFSYIFLAFFHLVPPL